jgi:hypothetical protein
MEGVRCDMKTNVEYRILKTELATNKKSYLKNKKSNLLETEYLFKTELAYSSCLKENLKEKVRLTVQKREVTNWYQFRNKRPKGLVQYALFDVTDGKRLVKVSNEALSPDDFYFPKLNAVIKFMNKCEKSKKSRLFKIYYREISKWSNHKIIYFKED